MPIIVWTKDFSVGNDAIDEQHKRWITIYNRAHDRMMTCTIEALSTLGADALKEMITYTEFHFSFEEQFMESIGYPDLSNHRKLHRQFCCELDRIALLMHQGEGPLNSEIVKLIETWLRSHILNEDKKIKESGPDPCRY
ncbi:MAG: bacteriohemerythrin [Pseudomonadota bacterium]